MAKVFISYRRKDSRHITDRLYDRLAGYFDKNDVFKDVDSIPYGADFRRKLEEAVGGCAVLVAVIGPEWLTTPGEDGRPRLHDPDDFVRIEVEGALRRGIPVVPVLVDGAPMPRREDLPPGLEDLAYRNATVVRPDPDFHRDVDRLIAAVERSAAAGGVLPFVEQVATLYALMDYQVERGRAVAGRTTDLFLTGQFGDLPVYRLVACRQGPLDAGTVQRLGDLVRSARREYRGITGTVVTGTVPAPEVASLADAEDVRVTTFGDLAGQLYDGRGYAEGLLRECNSDEQRYPVGLYVEPRIGEDVQGDDRLAFQVLDRWLKDETWNQLTLLGDVGTGKTFLTRMLASRLARSFLENPSARPLPLLIDLRDADREFSMEGLVLTHVARRGLGRVSFRVFEHALTQGRMVLLLDGFDEMAARTSPQVTHRNFRELARGARGRAKVLLTCRTHYFTSRTEEEEVVLGASAESGSPLARALFRDLTDRQGFRIAYLRPFAYPEIRRYVELARPQDAAACLKKIETIYNLIELSQRPMLLQMIVKSIDKLGSSEINPAQLYKVFTDVWILRDKWRRVLSPEKKTQFLTALARSFWRDGVLEIHHSRLIEHLRSELAAEIQDPRHLVEIDSEIRTASFLSRDDKGHYGFAHKSYAEYFLATDLAARLNQGDMECLRTKRLTLEILTFLKDLLDVERVEPKLEGCLAGAYRPEVSENTLVILYGVRRQSLLEPTLSLAAEPSELVVPLPEAIRLPGGQLAGLNLEGAVLRGADLSGANLSSTILLRCDLADANLGGANLEKADLTGATVSGADFRGANLRSALLRGVIREKAVRAEGANWQGASLSGLLATDVRNQNPRVDYLTSAEGVEGGRSAEDLWQFLWPEILSMSHWVRRRQRSEMGPEEIASEVALILLQRPDYLTRIQEGDFALRGFLAQLCRLVVSNTSKRNIRRREVVSFTDTDACAWNADPLEQTDSASHLWKVINAVLRPDELHLLELLFIRELSRAKIAAAMKVSPATVQNRWSRIRAKLQVALESPDLR